jgi:RES domain-containing protein
LFASGLDADCREKLVQALLNAFDRDLIAEGSSGRDVGDLWVRPGSEIWAGAEDERSFLTPPERWQSFVREVSHESRYFRLDPEIDPQTYLTPALLKNLARGLGADTPLYRAVIGGVPERGGLAPLPSDRMAGPEREHSKEGMRVNAAGVPMLYAAKRVATAIAEVRPWVGAPVSLATLRLERPVRLVDFSPRRRRSRAAVAGPTKVTLAHGVDQRELNEILTTIGAAMARPIDPADSQVSYVPTQYVAEIVRRAGYDGVMFKSAVAAGVNVVLFDKWKARVDGVALYRVNKVRYESAPAPTPPPSLPNHGIGKLLEDDDEEILDFF